MFLVNAPSTAGRMTGRRALITGGSSGVGAATARGFAAGGAPGVVGGPEPARMARRAARAPARALAVRPRRQPDRRLPDRAGCRPPDDRRRTAGNDRHPRLGRGEASDEGRPPRVGGGRLDADALPRRGVGAARYPRKHPKAPQTILHPTPTPATP